MPRAVLKSGDTCVSIFCPGCGHPHTLPIREKVGDRPSWLFDGNFDLPTLQPSIHVNPPGGQHHSKTHPICHSFVRAGRIEYLNDSTHGLSGQTIDLPEYPEEWA